MQFNFYRNFGFSLLTLTCSIGPWDQNFLDAYSNGLSLAQICFNIIKERT